MKPTRKLQLRREALVELDDGSLREVAAGTSFVFQCLTVSGCMFTQPFAGCTFACLQSFDFSCYISVCC